ncbi:MAG: hypothetical protein HYX62_01940 [Gammaproteobacteria bacterium]|nr:hypothetical protein [Gammaproteobacteria bacterium]
MQDKIERKSGAYMKLAASRPRILSLILTPQCALQRDLEQVLIRILFQNANNYVGCDPTIDLEMELLPQRHSNVVTTHPGRRFILSFKTISY